MCCSWWGSVTVMVLFGGSLLFQDLPLHKDRIVDWPSQSNCGLLGGNRALHTYGWGWSWSSVPRLGILPVLLFNRPFSDHRCGSPWSPCRLGWCSRVRQMFKSSSFLASHKGAISFRKVIFTSYVFVDLKWGFKSSRPKKYCVYISLLCIQAIVCGVWDMLSLGLHDCHSPVPLVPGTRPPSRSAFNECVLLEP